jgi:small-conductance mechanosensitive channel
MNELWQAVVGALSRPLLGAPAWQWGAYVLVTLGIFLAAWLVLRVVRGRLLRADGKAAPRHGYLLHALGSTRSFGVLGLAAFLALYVVPLPAPDVVQGLRTLALVLLFLQAGLWGSALIDEALARGFRAARVDEGAARTASGVVRWFALVLLWVSVALLVLSAFNVAIAPLLAGLGVAGIAVAFALQRILGDVFASVAIVVDRPFEVGDFIAVGDFQGTVEQIGIKSTRLRGVGGEQISIANSDLVASRIRNYKRMQERRAAFGFGVAYSTPAEKLERVPGLLKDVVAGVAGTRFDRAHLLALGESALRFEVVYFVLSPDYTVYADVQQRINLAVLRGLSELGVEMATPSGPISLGRDASPDRPGG